MRHQKALPIQRARRLAADKEKGVAMEVIDEELDDDRDYPIYCKVEASKRAEYKQRLEELRKLPMPCGRILPSDEEYRWMSEEERDMVEWFDRHEYETFMLLSNRLDDYHGWIIPYCRYICWINNLVPDDFYPQFGFPFDWVIDYPLAHVLEEIKIAAQNGNGRAQNALGILLERGFKYRDIFPGGRDYFIPCDIKSARDWFRKSAESGCIQGMANYAAMLFKGNGGECNIPEAIKWYEKLAMRGDGQSCYMMAYVRSSKRFRMRDLTACANWLRKAAEVGFPKVKALVEKAGEDASAERLVAEYIIGFLQEQAQAIKQCRLAAPDYTVESPVNGSVHYDVAFVKPAEEHGSQSTEANEKESYDNAWLLADKPSGTVLPPASGRETIRTPNLNSANPSFAARLILYVRDKFNGDAPSIYRAAHVSRKTYSSIISNELRPVSKQTAIAFALALQLSIDEANGLLSSAGHALSTFMLEDIIVKACIVAGIHDIMRVNQIMSAHNAKPLLCQD